MRTTGPTTLICSCCIADDKFGRYPASKAFATVREGRLKDRTNSLAAPPMSRALLLSGILVLVLVGLASQFVWQGQQDTIDRGRDRAQIAAQTVAAHFQWFTEASRQALQRIEEAATSHPELLESSVQRDLDQAVASLPAGVYIRVFDAQGRQSLSTKPEDGSVNVADRDYFETVRDGTPIVISALLQDRLTGEQGFVIARRIERGGQSAGVATIVVPAGLMAEFWSTLQLGPGSATSIFRNDGQLVARFPPPEGPVDLSRHVLFTQHLPQSPAGSYVSPVSPANGVARLVGYSRVKEAPLVAVAAIATDFALEGFHTRVRRLLIGTVPLLGALIILAWRVRTYQRRDAAQRRELEGTLAENQLLLREVHHRVKNNLQTIASLIQLQNMDPEVKRDLRNRITAMARVHEHIYSAERLGDIDAAAYLQQVAEGVRAGFGANVAIGYAIEPIRLHPDQALAVGSILTELVSNSMKHSFTDGHAGAISIALAGDAHGRATLKVADNGQPFDPSASGKGLGLRLIKGFATQLHADYQLDGSNGLDFKMTFPLQCLHAK